MKITGSSGDRERIAIFVPNGRDMEEFIKKMREAYPVSDGALQLFLRHTERVTLPKGHLLIRDGVVEKYSYFIVRGFARGFLYRDGKDATIWFATAGMSLLSMNAYLFRSSGYENVELLEECDLLKISNETLDGLFEKEVELANWSRRMSDRIILRMERLFVERYFLTLPAAGRTRAGNSAKSSVAGYRLLPRHFAGFPESDPRRRTIDSPESSFLTFVNRKRKFFTDFCGL